MRNLKGLSTYEIFNLIKEMGANINQLEMIDDLIEVFDDDINVALKHYENLNIDVKRDEYNKLQEYENIVEKAKDCADDIAFKEDEINKLCANIKSCKNRESKILMMANVGILEVEISDLKLEKYQLLNQIKEFDL